jgi:hypothetical protein
MDFLASFIPVALMLAAFGIYLWSGTWAYSDAKKRGKPPVFVALLVLLGAWPLGLLLWIVFRPEGGGRPPFNLDDYRVR